MENEIKLAEAVKIPRRKRAIPKVRVYSRHRENCKYFKRGDDRVGCGCPKQLVYFREGKLHRIAADTCDGAVAEQKAAELMAGFASAAKGEPTPVPAGRLTTLIEDAIKTFVETTAAKGVTEKHIRVLKYDLGNFAQFALNRGLVNLGDVRTEDCAAYSNQLTGAINTRAKKVFRLIGFFSFCIEMNWIQRNPAQTRAVIIKKSDAQKPKALDEAQFAQLLEAVQKMNGQTTDQQKRAMRSLVLLMKWSGLAVRDAVTIERAKFEPNGDGFTKLYLHRAKTGHAAFATLENEIVAQIMAGANPSGKYLFIDALPTSERAMDNLISNWGNLFSKLGECADLKDADGVPFHFTSHCLRHSFAFFCFNSGMPTEDVAMLLGDSVAVVAAHYSGWVQGRQERLTERMKAALASRHQK